MADFEKLEWTLDQAENDNFTNYSKLGETRNPSRENQPFAFPGPFSRNIAGTDINQKMKRGFMRSIIMDQSIAGAFKTKSPGNLRLNFQFNPEYIERNVSQSPGAVNPLLQNPANLTQAVPGTAQFNFTMMFNREAEVAQRERDLLLSGTGTTDDSNARQARAQGFDIDDGLASSAMTDPGQVGVMHDLSIFDSIIGQGITSELVDVITAYTRQQVVASTNDPDKPEDAKIITFEEADFKTSVKANYGNSAFLNPMPVRIVFSDLFMVEGLVVGSAVAFQKFSQEMIPTICQVNCNVYALYVGFAKKKAFLTDNLASWAVDTAKTDAALAAEVVKETKATINSLVTLSLGVNVQPEDKRLTVPNYNTIAMKIFTPTSNGKFLESAEYYGGNGNTSATSWVTLPQYFNAFAAGAGRMRDIADTQFVGGDVLGGFTNSTLPITIYLETTDKEFNNVSSTFTATIIDTVTSQTKDTVTSNNGNKWVSISKNRPEFGFVNENSKTPVKIYGFKNTFNIDPVDVTSVKQTINSNSKCDLELNIKFNKTLSNGTTVIHSIKQVFTYNGTDPFFYENNDGVSNSNAVLVKNKTVNLKRGGGGGVNRR